MDGVLGPSSVPAALLPWDFGQPGTKAAAAAIAVVVVHSDQKFSDDLTLLRLLLLLLLTIHTTTTGLTLLRLVACWVKALQGQIVN